MARSKTFSGNEIRNMRIAAGLSQREFWNRLGITQSAGSRYELGGAIPVPTAMVLWLLKSRRISDMDIRDGLKAVEAGRGAAT